MLKRHLNLIKLICYFIIMPIVVWSLTIGKSLNLWRECKKNKTALSELQLSKNTEESNKLDISANGSLLDSIAKDKSIEIVKYNRYIATSAEDYALIVNVLVVSGDYFNLLEAVNLLEGTWIINSLSFQTEMNYKTRQTNLHATIVTQEIVKL